ncbi:MAG: hypothetical protein IAE83_21865 [Anaerolinea sp.]|nr:hypothetical protein [Anaerolinea sp.]
MSWTPPETRTAGDLLSAASYNTEVRDNLIFLHGGKTIVPIAHYGGVYTLSSSTWAAVDSANLAPTLTLSTGRVLIAFAGGFYADAAARLLSLDLEIDGTRIGGADGIIKESLDTVLRTISFSLFQVGLSAGSHQFKLMWKVGAGTATLASDANFPVHLGIAEW